MTIPLKPPLSPTLSLFKSSTIYLITFTHISCITQEGGQVLLSLLVICIHLGLGDLHKVLGVGTEMWGSQGRLELDTLFNEPLPGGSIQYAISKQGRELDHRFINMPREDYLHTFCQ